MHLHQVDNPPELLLVLLFEHFPLELVQEVELEAGGGVFRVGALGSVWLAYAAGPGRTVLLSPHRAAFVARALRASAY